jgi:hypothetical protein
MPSTPYQATTEDPMGLLINSVQYAHLLREMRRSPSMGSVFHLANHRHWKDMSMDRLKQIKAANFKETLVHGVAAMSSKLVLQMLQAGAADLTCSFNHLHITAELEFDALIDMYQQRAEADNGVFTALEGYHVFSIAVYNITRQRPDRLLRQCIDTLTAISQRFSGIRSLRNALYRFIDLAADDRINAEMKVLQLDHELQQLDGTIPSRHHNHMRSILVQLAEDHHAITRGFHSRRETMPSI